MAANFPTSCLRRSMRHVSRAVSHAQVNCRARRAVREFSQSFRRDTRQRGQMWAWMNGPGSVFRAPRPGSTNYLGAYDKFGRLVRGDGRLAESREMQKKESEDEEEGMMESGEEGSMSRKANVDKTDKDSTPPETLEDLMPFPLNPYFRSQPVLSEGFRDEIYRRVVSEGHTIRKVSMDLHVEMRRVAAVVRLKTVEQDWGRQGKRFAKPYQEAVLAMVPQTQYTGGRSQPRHESINDLPVHPATLQQLWYSTSESRVFTRTDAGRVFDKRLLPADERIPHPQMIEDARYKLEGVPELERRRRLETILAEQEATMKAEKQKIKDREEKHTKVVHGARWDFKFRDMSVEDVGKDGRASMGTGWRYGAPHYDRKKGQIKIPTSVA